MNVRSEPGALIECQNETSHSWDRILMLFTSALFDDIGSKPISMYTRESSFHIENSFENSLVQQRCEMSKVLFSQSVVRLKTFDIS